MALQEQMSSLHTTHVVGYTQRRIEAALMSLAGEISLEIANRDRALEELLRDLGARFEGYGSYFHE